MTMHELESTLGHEYLLKTKPFFFKRSKNKNQQLVLMSWCCQK